MEILRFLLSFLLKEYGGDDLGRILQALNSGEFDLKTFLDGIKIESLAPILKNIFGAKNPSEVSDGLSPVLDIADKDIIDALNCYFEQTPLGV